MTRKRVVTPHDALETCYPPVLQSAHGSTSSSSFGKTCRRAFTRTTHVMMDGLSTHGCHSFRGQPSAQFSSHGRDICRCFYRQAVWQFNGSFRERVEHLSPTTARCPLSPACEAECLEAVLRSSVDQRRGRLFVVSVPPDVVCLSRVIFRRGPHRTEQ